MQLSAFMVPAEKVITVSPNDTIKMAMDLMVEHNIGAIVVLVTGTYHVPIGIVTKTDLVKACHDNVTLNLPVKEIMSHNLATCVETMSRDQAARVLEKNKNHHALVVDKNCHFKGLISLWDITVECAKDDRAWPWNRSEDGKFHKPNENIVGTSPTSTTMDITPVADRNVRPITRRSQMGDSFRGYVDTLGYFD
jgi:CBS domain-containing protein